MRLPLRVLENFDEFVLSSRWTTATSAPMQKYPHQYTLRKRSVRPALFDQSVLTIRSFGVPGKFYSRFFTYFDHGDWKYWTMNDPINEVHLINRAPIEQMYGRQDAPAASTADEPSIYDFLAPVYDARYDTEECEHENNVVTSMLGDLSSKRVLDIGCGTGLLLDLLPINKRMYRGIDPSQGMVNEFLRKHPGYWIEAISLAECDLANFDIAVGLFGVGSYLTLDEIRKIPTIARSWLLMFYAEGYAPSYYNGETAWQSGQAERLQAARQLGETEVTHLSNYIIVKGHHGLEA